ncbi:MAG: zinc ribbon domain-containing protein [Gammaproteobacteria bacterium]
MPIYEYACRDCGKQFEQLVRADNPPECPHCSGHRLEKLLSAFAVNSDSGGEPCAEEMCGRCGNAPGSCAMN